MLRKTCASSDGSMTVAFPEDGVGLPTDTTGGFARPCSAGAGGVATGRRSSNRAGGGGEAAGFAPAWAGLTDAAASFEPALV